MMLASTLLDNIRADLISEMIPWIRFAPTANHANFLWQSARAVPALVGRQTLLTAVTIVERNCIEYAIRNYITPKPGLGDQLLVRFSSAAAASFLTELCWKPNSGVAEVIVLPVLSGTIAAIAVLLWETPTEEAVAFLRSKVEGVEWYENLNQRFRIEELIGDIRRWIKNVTSGRALENALR
jgi:hypothetical protein